MFLDKLVETIQREKSKQGLMSRFIEKQRCFRGGIHFRLNDVWFDFNIVTPAIPELITTKLFRIHNDILKCLFHSITFALIAIWRLLNWAN